MPDQWPFQIATSTPPPKPRTIEDAVKLMRTAKGWRDSWNICCFYGGCVSLFNATQHVESFERLSDLLDWLDERQPSKTVTVTLSREAAEQYIDGAGSYSNYRHVLNAIKKALEQ